MNTRHKQTQVWSSLQENNSANVKLPPCNKLAPKSIQKLTSDLLLYYSHDHQWERRSSWSVLLTSHWCLFSKGGVGEEGKEKEEEREGGEKSNLLLHWNMGLVSKPGGPSLPPAGVQFYDTFVSVLLSKYPEHGEIPHQAAARGQPRAAAALGSFPVHSQSLESPGKGQDWQLPLASLLTHTGLLSWLEAYEEGWGAKNRIIC